MEISFNFDSSGTLKTQIQNGADCDLFISAAQKQMNQLDITADKEVNTEGLDFVASDSRVNLLENKVVLVVPEGNPKGIKGFDILAYRHVVDGEKLAREFCAAIDAEICIAGSINSYARIDTMFDIGPWTFTMGSALFEKKFVADGSFRDNLKAVADYMAAK